MKGVVLVKGNALMKLAMKSIIRDKSNFTNLTKLRNYL